MKQGGFVAVEGTPFKVVECDWLEGPVSRFAAVCRKVWERLPAVACAVLTWYVAKEGTPVIRLASDRRRWRGSGGWGAFDPKDRTVWFHCSPFAYVEDTTLLEAGVAHELAHALFFVLGEKWHQRTTVYGGPEWLVEALLGAWRYDPDHADTWRRFLFAEDDLLPPRQPAMDDDAYAELAKERESVKNDERKRRQQFLAETKPYLDVASGKGCEAYLRLAEEAPQLLIQVLAGQMSLDAALSGDQTSTN